ncbi:MAG TPA: hypothetical protein VF469_16490 [Kofleriaceae bacterium]
MNMERSGDHARSVRGEAHAVLGAVLAVLGAVLGLVGSAAVGCGSGGTVAPDAAGPDAGPVRVATGKRLVDHAAVVGGLTSDG